MEPPERAVRIAAEAMEEYAAQLLAAAGVPPRDAATVARCLVLADLRGAESHGVVRLPVCLDRVGRGHVNPAPALVARRTSAASEHVDGLNGLGFVVASHATAVALDLARDSGVGLVGVCGSSHFKMAANCLLAAAEAGFAAMVLSNAAPALPPWSGRAAMFGTRSEPRFPSATGRPSCSTCRPAWWRADAAGGRRLTRRRRCRGCCCRPAAPGARGSRCGSASSAARSPAPPAPGR